MQIVEVRLAARDLAAQHAFYVETLGLQPLGRTDTALAVAAGATRLVFERTAEDQAVYHIAFNIPQNMFAGAKTWLTERGVPLISLEGRDEFDFRSWNAHATYFFDGAGNILEFIARHSLPNAAEGTFGPQHILHVSEVGWPVPDVPATVASLTGALDVQPWNEQSPAFAPVGDEYGLFIVVNPGRPWFPTDRASTVSPIGLTLRGTRPADYRLHELPYTVTIV